VIVSKLLIFIFKSVLKLIICYGYFKFIAFCIAFSKKITFYVFLMNIFNIKSFLLFYSSLLPGFPVK